MYELTTYVQLADNVLSPFVFRVIVRMSHLHVLLMHRVLTSLRGKCVVPTYNLRVILFEVSVDHSQTERSKSSAYTHTKMLDGILMKLCTIV